MSAAPAPEPDFRPSRTRVAFLLEADRALRRSLDLDATLAAMARLLIPALADWCVVDLVGEDDHRLTRVAGSHRDPARAVLLGRDVGRVLGRDAAQATARVVETGRYLTLRRIDDPAVLAAGPDAEDTALIRTLGLGPLVCVPVTLGEGVCGALACVRDPARPAFKPLEISLLRTVARRAADAVVNCRRHQKVVTASRAKDEFLAMLGHELRNPLAAIRDAARALERAGDTDAAAAGLRAIVRRQAEHVSRLVDDLLDLSRLERGKLVIHHERVSLQDLAQRCGTAFETTGRLAGQRLEVQAELVDVQGDPVRLEQILGNLLDNAVKYTPAGGRIRVTVRRQDGWAVLRVVDTGSGITPELLPRVFELFTQGAQALDRERGGLGIGLTLVRRLVELHGGQVTLASDGTGRGTTVEIRLPAVESAPPRAARPAARPPAPRTRRILIVEDNADAREALRMALEIDGHQVETARNGAEAMARMGEAAPDVALIDIGLPGMDGYALAREIRTTEAGGRRTRLIALTGYGRPEDRLRAREAGFDDHLVKPADPQALARLLEAGGMMSWEGADGPGEWRVSGD